MHTLPCAHQNTACITTGLSCKCHTLVIDKKRVLYTCVAWSNFVQHNSYIYPVTYPTLMTSVFHHTSSKQEHRQDTQTILFISFTLVCKNCIQTMGIKYYSKNSIVYAIDQNNMRCILSCQPFHLA